MYPSTQISSPSTSPLAVDTQPNGNHGFNPREFLMSPQCQQHLNGAAVGSGSGIFGARPKMYSAQNFFLRAAIVLCLAVAVLTILYFTPTPDEFFHSCDRPCHALDWPMICRVRLVIDLESLKNTGCSSNTSDCSMLDQTSSTSLKPSPSPAFQQIVVNDDFPGPAIHVCQNDVLVVDVVNRLDGSAVAIHWRGQQQTEAPFMDGAPMITQCPITSFTTFQYKFRASRVGTHLWHSFGQSDVARGLYGALVVRQTEVRNPQRKLYDFDEKPHVLVVSDVDDRLLVINGQSYGAIFNVTRTKRYRFRVAYLSSGACAMTLSIAGHNLKVISLDGDAISPYEVSAINLADGERVDFVLKAKYSFAEYTITVRSTDELKGSKCAHLQPAEATLQYQGGQQTATITGDEQQEVQKAFAHSSAARVFTTNLCDSQLGVVCAGDVQAIKKMPEALRETDVDQRFYLGFDRLSIPSEKDGSEMVYRLNNITFMYPDSPLLTQYNDVPYQSTCNTLRKPERCKNVTYCECVHVENIRLGATVEIILFDQSGFSHENVFHMHGYPFHLVGNRVFGRSMSEQELRDLDNEGKLFRRNLLAPVVKDTVRVPRFGAVAFRFIAENPGFWMLRDEYAPQWTRGMDMVFHVGALSHVPSTPSNFPTCGSWVGPDFFLL